MQICRNTPSSCSNRTIVRRGRNSPLGHIDQIHQRAILDWLKFCALTLAARQGRFCFIRPLHCHPLPVPYRAYIPRSSLPSWVIRLSGNVDKSTQHLCVEELA